MQPHPVSGGAYGSSPRLSSPHTLGRMGSRVSWQYRMSLGLATEAPNTGRRGGGQGSVGFGRRIAKGLRGMSPVELAHEGEGRHGASHT